MKVFFELIRKETFHLLRDRRMMIVAVLIPVVQMLLFGFAISTEVNNVNVAVSYQKYDENIRQQIDRLSNNPYITIMATLPPSEVETTLRKGLADAVVLWHDSESAQVILDASNPNLATTAAVYIQNILSGITPSNASTPIMHMLYNPLLKSSYNFVPGIMGMIFMLICAMMTAISIVREKETGTIEVLLVSPVRPIFIIISKMVPFFVLSCGILTVILCIAYFLLDVPMSAGIFSIVAVAFIYIFLSLALGLLVSTMAKTQVVAMLISGMVMIVPVIMLSGMIFPIDNLPVVLKEISFIVPARWFISAMRKLMIMGLPLSQVAEEVLVLSGMALLVIVIALKKFNDKID